MLHVRQTKRSQNFFFSRVCLRGLFLACFVAYWAIVRPETPVSRKRGRVLSNLHFIASGTSNIIVCCRHLCLLAQGANACGGGAFPPRRTLCSVCHLYGRSHGATFGSRRAIIVLLTSRRRMLFSPRLYSFLRLWTRHWRFHGWHQLNKLCEAHRWTSLQDDGINCCHSFGQS